MKSKFVKRTKARRLIVIYAGLGMDWHPFCNLTHPSYDIMVVYDYRELTFNWKPFLRYDEICLIAWSVGVFAASVTAHEIEPRVTMRIAVNGTLWPIDSNKGVPPEVWHTMQATLSMPAWRTFKRRMCDSHTQYEDLRANDSRRSVDDIRREMESLETNTIFHVDQLREWDMAIVGTHDAFFSPAAQEKAWSGVAPVRMLECGHMPDFAQLVRRLVIDKAMVERRYKKAKALKAENIRLAETISETLMRHFDSVHGSDPVIGNVIEIGAGREGTLTRLWYGRTDNRAKRMLWDLAFDELDVVYKGSYTEKCDAEVRMKRQPTASAAYIFSSSTIQWFNSVRQFLCECSRVLISGGYVALSSFTPDNLEEMTVTTGKGLQLATKKEWRDMMPPELELLVYEESEYTLRFDTRREVLEHFRDCGHSGVAFGDSPYITARKLLEDYPADPETGLFNVTYRPVFVVARKITET